jgi:hypothetical protein
MRWHHVLLHHGRKDGVDLYVSDDRGMVEVITASAHERVCFSASRAMGQVKAIRLDQHGRTVPWDLVSLPAYCRSPEMDSRHNEVIAGHESTLDDLKYDIANAMNRTLHDRGFSQFAKKHIVGRWTARDSELTFAADGSYSCSGIPVAVPFPPPKNGRWSIGANMLHLMTKENDRGIRVAIVSIDASELRLHGRCGYLFHVYERTA